MKYDIIIIGAGLGGLTAGAKLAKEGKKVLLVEQHDRPGGCATTFKRKDFVLEVGLHEMDGLHPRDMKTKLFKDLGIFEKVTFLEVPEFYRFVNTRHDIIIPHDPDVAKKTLLNSFPEEEKGINAYFEHVLNARKILSQSKEKADRSVGEFLDEIIKNDDLKLVLLGNLGYFHDDPYSLSYYYYLTAQGSYYGGRANFIKGGSQKLSDALAEIIKEYGGEVKLRNLVSSLVYKDDKPVGINYINLRDKKEITDYADEIIVNSSVPVLANKLMPDAYGDELADKIKDIEIGASLLTVYYGFGKSLKDLGNKYYSTFIYDDSVSSQKDILANNHSGFDTRSFAFVDYSQVDSALAPAGKSVGAVCCVDYPSDWEGLTKEEYRKKKDEIAKIITARMEKLIPGFSDVIEYVEVATSLSVKRYTLNPEGAVYGFAQKPGKNSDYLSALPDNLHISSAWGKFGGGFSGVIFSGYMTAMGILRKRKM